MKSCTEDEFAAVVDELVAEVEEMLEASKASETVTLAKRGGWWLVMF